MKLMKNLKFFLDNKKIENRKSLLLLGLKGQANLALRAGKTA